MTTTQQLIDLNQLYAKRFGWTPADFASERPPSDEIDDATIDAIKVYQAANHLVADGVAGIKTFTSLISAQHAALHVELAAQIKAKKTGALITAGKLAVRTAKLTWLTSVVDLPPTQSPHFEFCRKTIDDLIRTPRGINWTWNSPYRTAKSFRWCGTIPAEGWGAAGISMEIRQKFFASNYRLRVWASYEAFDNTALGLNRKPPTGPYRQIIDLDDYPESTNKPINVHFSDGSTPREGDIMLIGPRDLDDGLHITMLDRTPDPSDSLAAYSNYVATIEGNGSGYFPDGSYGRGCVRSSRQMTNGPSAGNDYVGRYLLRPSLTDLAGWA